MSLGILLVTHGALGAALLESASGILGKLPSNVQAVAVQLEDQPEALAARVEAAYQAVECGSGVMILCDLIGATPCNSCCALRERHPVKVVTGVNLPALLRALTHRDEALGLAAQRCAATGAQSITECYDGD